MSQSKEEILWQACTEGDFEVARTLADDPAVDVNWGDPEKGRTPFYRACGHGWTSVVEYLMRNPRVDVVKQQSQRATPFLIACENNHKEVVMLLLADPRIDPNEEDDGGFTPISIACQNGHKEVVSLLLADPRIDPMKPSNDGPTPFFMACQNGHKEVVSLLLADPRFDPDKPSNDGTTPFSVVCQNGHKEVVSQLLACLKIDLNKADDEGLTPISVACQNGHREVVSLLLADPRIDPNKPKNNHATPLWYASQNGHLVVVQHLLASGREIDTERRSAYNNKTAAEHGRRIVPRGPDDTDEDYYRKKTNGPLCADLIDEYEREPEHLHVFHRLRRQPGLREYFIGHLFALVVFHSDSFVVINERLAHSGIRRFFRICARLPLDVQMVLCNRAFGSPKDIILSRDSEPGFKCLARTTTWQQ